VSIFVRILIKFLKLLCEVVVINCWHGTFVLHVENCIKNVCEFVCDLCDFSSNFMELFAYFGSNILARDNWCLMNNFEISFGV
jgi:hypothetical protein